jgi:hypothetical protein
MALRRRQQRLYRTTVKLWRLKVDGVNSVITSSYEALPGTFKCLRHDKVQLNMAEGAQARSPHPNVVNYLEFHFSAEDMTGDNRPDDLWVAQDVTVGAPTNGQYYLFKGRPSISTRLNVLAIAADTIEEKDLPEGIVV